MSEHKRYYARKLIGAIIVATVSSVIFSSIALYSLNRYLEFVDGTPALHIGR